MSRSKKDGRHGGGHIDYQMREVWSRRCPLVATWRKASRKHRHHPSYKTITHRYERRVAKREITEFVP